jgi:hypothetical protein
MFAVTEFFRPEDEQNWIKVFEEKEEAFAYAREQAKETYDDEIDKLSDPDDAQIEFTEGVDDLNIRLQVYGGLMAWIWSVQKIK